MDKLKWMLKMAVDMVFALLIVNALVIIVGWFIYPPVIGYQNAWNADWLISVTTFAVKTFIWLLPISALIVLLGVMFDTEMIEESQQV